jgi:hypothetical protein
MSSRRLLRSKSLSSVKEHAKLDNDSELRPIHRQNRYLANTSEANTFKEKEDSGSGHSTLVVPQDECAPGTGTSPRDTVIRKTTHINVWSTSHLETQNSVISRSDF